MIAPARKPGPERISRIHRLARANVRRGAIQLVQMNGPQPSGKARTDSTEK